MPKKCSTAMAAIRILEELRKTDRNHPITQTQLAEKLDCERKTIARVLTIMEVEMNFRPGRVQGHGIYYEKNEKDFTPYEIRLLADAVLACKSMSAQEARALVKKLTHLLNDRESKRIPRTPLQGTSDPMPQCNFFLNIDMVSEALERRKQIRFLYYKEDEPPQERTVSPGQMTFYRGYYVLLGITEANGQPCIFHLNRMENIQILEDLPSFPYNGANLEHRL